ncbi:unnamed protein product [Porites evermanni]|uniref:Tyr recombinase domain-containing protein n=1 Tax=Porites evermanni TaxID=104178 RepID=A0ABN8QD28_9CNID|nr:unnamed protein product [Porites evermanni]
MLIALTAAQRCQTLTFLDISEQYMQKNDTRFNFALTEHLRQDKPGKVNFSKLLVSYIKPYKAVALSTIGGWIKTLLGQAGVDTEIFSGHSTRCASTSKLSKSLMSVSTDVILATAG